MKTSRYVLATTIATLVLMFVFEAIKEEFFATFFYHDLSRWESHAITISFTTVTALVISTSFFRIYASLKAKAEALNLKKEKLRTLQQSMHKMSIHANRLSARFQLLKQEYRASNQLSEDTLQRMENSVDITTREIQALFALDDPFDSRQFNIGFLPELPQPSMRKIPPEIAAESELDAGEIYETATK